MQKLLFFRLTLVSFGYDNSNDASYIYKRNQLSELHAKMNFGTLQYVDIQYSMQMEVERVVLTSVKHATTDYLVS